MSAPYITSHEHSLKAIFMKLGIAYLSVMQNTKPKHFSVIDKLRLSKWLRKIQKIYF